MRKLVESLWRLQEYDTRLNHLRLQKGDLPVVIEDLDQSLRDKKDTSDQLKERIEKLKADRKLFEKEIEASKEQLKKYEDQLYTVKNNKEYDAISMEIDTKKAEVESLESKIIQTMEEEDALKGDIEGLGEDVTSLNSQLSENRKELEEIDAHTHAEEEKLLAEREAVAKEIDTRFIRQYERIRKAKDGLAVVPVMRGSCGGCFSAVPPQRLAEIKDSNRLHHCEYCGRILVWIEEKL